MKVSFIYLPHPYLKQPNAQMPLGLLYLAAVLEKENIDVEVKNYSSFLTYEALQDINEADIFGITVTSLELPQANRFACLLKEKYPKSKVILGGPGTYSHEFVDWTFIDSICIGDGEIEILKICNDIRNNKMHQMYVGTPVENLDNIPFPAKHLLKGTQGGNIFAYDASYRKGESTIVTTSRGCPYQCAFCGAPFFTKQRGKVKFRSPENVVAELKHIIENYNIKQIRFSDDMFTANRQRCLKLCSQIAPLDIAYRVSIRTKPFSKELAKALYNSGCKEVSFGVESFDNNVLKLLNKGITAEDSVRALEICKEVGLKTRILFMIRTPGQTRNTVPINISYLDKVPYDIIACTSFVPLPASDIWMNPDKYGIEILSKNLDKYNFYFYGSHGVNKLEDIIKIKNRSLDEFNHETQMFREYLKSTGKLNIG